MPAATLSPDPLEACQFTAAGGYYEVAESTNKHRPSPIRQRNGEDRILDKHRRSRAIGTSRQTARNFAVAGWMVRKHLDYVTEFDFQVRTESRTFNDEVEGRMKEWGRPANCDAGGLHPLPRMIRIAEARRVIDGDVALLKLKGGRLQGLEGDLIRDPDLPRRDAERWSHGVKKGPGGRHVAYSLWKRGARSSGYTFDRIAPASNVLLHGFFEYFSQTRGISPVNAAINTLTDVKTGFDLALTKAKVAQLIALAFMRGAGEGFGAVEEGEAGNRQYSVDFGAGPVVLDLDEGDDVKFVESNQPSTQFQEFTTLSIAVALKALDLPFSFYDESFTNFFGSRAAWQHYDRSCRSKRRDVADLLRRITVWKLTEWILDGSLTLPRGLTLGGLPFEWVPLGMPWWKPESELKADVEGIQAGLTTPQNVCRKNGTGDFYDNVDAIQKAIEYAEKAGVPLSFALAKQPAEGDDLAARLAAIEEALEELRDQGVIE